MVLPLETPTEDDPADRYAVELVRSCQADPTLPTPLLPRTSPGSRAGPKGPVTDWADSGSMLLTGEREGPPRFAAGPLATVARGVGRTLASLAPGSGLAQLDAAGLLAERAAISGLERNGLTSPGGSAHLLRTARGWIAVNLPRDEDWRSLPAWLETSPQAIPSGDVPALRNAVRNQDGPRLVERGRLLGLAVTRAAESIPVRSRAFDRRALSHRSEPIAARPPRVLDLSNLWAGPLASSLLLQAGFEVLKIEAPERPDGARFGPEAFFHLMNAGKSGCTLDLHAAADRGVFEGFLEASDIVVESARPRGLEQLGYDAESWVRARPGRLWISVTGHGRSAPERDWIAYGDDAAIAAGLGWPPDGALPADPSAPCFCADAVADPLAGLHAAAVGLAHWRMGIGGLLDFSLSGVAAAAAGFDAGALSAPLVRIGEDWFIETDTGPKRIAAPRARRIRSAAPELAAPSGELISHWTKPC